MKTDEILSTLQVGNKSWDTMTTEGRMVRAALIDEYVERTTPEDGDLLMDRLDDLLLEAA
jgi:hypothetical protein